MEINNFKRALESLSKGNIECKIIEYHDRAGYKLYLSSTTDVSYSGIMSNEQIFTNTLSKLRDNLLQSDLFYYERKELLEYKKLKDMKFVLDALKELDLSSIKEQKKEPEYLNIRKMLGGING
jgi:hypothetical protein